MTTKSALPTRLYLILVALIGDVPVPCYLIQMSDGTNILVDTGYADDAEPGPDYPPLVRLPNVIAQLAELGLQPADIDILICTHFDADHSGHHAAFPNAEFVVQRTHYVSGQTDERSAETRSQWNRPGLRYRLLDGDTELLPGLELFESSGHVPGHQAVLVRLPIRGPVLLTIDAVMDQGTFTAEGEAFKVLSDGQASDALKMREVAQRAGAKLVIFGHDDVQWPTLKKLPDYYE
jgi:N-acyl homoserine lactone hydrolase